MTALTATIVVDRITDRVYRLDPPLDHKHGPVRNVVVTRMGGEFTVNIADPEWGLPVKVAGETVVLASAGGNAGSWADVLDILGYSIVTEWCHDCGDPDALTTYRDISGARVSECGCGPARDGLKRRIIEGLVAA